MDASTAPAVRIQETTPALPPTAASSAALIPLPSAHQPAPSPLPSGDAGGSSSELSDVDDEETSTGKRKAEEVQEQQVKKRGRPAGGSHITDRCHQCRTSGMTNLLHCTGTREFTANGRPLPRAVPCNAAFCTRCLFNRYGDQKDEKADNSDWVCPVCRLVCNCSVCRRKRGLLPTGVMAGRVDNAEASTSTAPHAGPSNGIVNGIPTGHLVPPQPRKVDRLTQPPFPPLTLPPNESLPTLLDALQLREFIFRFHHLMLPSEPTQKGFKTAHEALTLLSNNLFTTWSHEIAPRIFLRGFLHLLETEAKAYRHSTATFNLDSRFMARALKETFTQSRFGHKCWNTVKAMLGEETTATEEEPAAPSNGAKEDGSKASDTEYEDEEEPDDEEGSSVDGDGMEVEEEAPISHRLPSPKDKVRLLTVLLERAILGEIIRVELQDGLDLATSARAAMFKSKREQGEVKNALKAELADLRNNFADPDEIEEVEQRMTDQAYDAREEMATHYVDSTSAKLRFRPVLQDGPTEADYYVPSPFTCSNAIPSTSDAIEQSCSYAVLAHRPADDTWYTFTGAKAIRSLAAWLEMEAKYHHYQAAIANQATPQTTGGAGPIAAAGLDVSASLKAFADFVEFKLVHEPDYTERKRERKVRAKKGSLSGGTLVDDEGLMRLK